MKKLKLFLIWLLLFASISFTKEVGFTQEDRERLIKLEATLKIFMEQTDKRFEELREDMNKRFEQLYTFLWIITGRFTTLTASVIAFAYWDRRTIIRKTKEETFEEMERELRPEKFKKLLNVLRDKAKTDKELEAILKKYGLL
ncbi:hypothetical protein [Aquifex sp.]